MSARIKLSPSQLDSLAEFLTALGTATTESGWRLSQAEVTRDGISSMEITYDGGEGGEGEYYLDETVGS
jgi:hypothetical protein